MTDGRMKEMMESHANETLRVLKLRDALCQVELEVMRHKQIYDSSHDDRILQIVQKALEP